jgi:hypothetical protein
VLLLSPRREDRDGVDIDINESVELLLRLRIWDWDGYLRHKLGRCAHCNRKLHPLAHELDSDLQYWLEFPLQPVPTDNVESDLDVILQLSYSIDAQHCQFQVILVAQTHSSGRAISRPDNELVPHNWTRFDSNGVDALHLAIYQLVCRLFCPSSTPILRQWMQLLQCQAQNEVGHGHAIR